MLRRAIDADDALLDALDRRGGRRHGDLDRIAQHLLGELGNVARHGRGEQQRLALRGQLRDDLADVVNEAHVEHAVGFVEHEKLDVAEAQRIAAHEVEQAARRGDEDVDAVEQRAHLAAHRHAADRQRGADAEMPAVGAEAVEDLAGQLARRAEHQDAAGLALRPPRVGGEMMQDRQRERGGLAGAGLRDADHVAARQDDAEWSASGSGWGDVFFFGKGARDRFGEAEVMKGGQ